MFGGILGHMTLNIFFHSIPLKVMPTYQAVHILYNIYTRADILTKPRVLARDMQLQWNHTIV